MSEADEQPLQSLKPLILEWLTKWKNDCSRFGSKMEFVYKNAIRSLKDYNDPVFTLHDVRKLKYFGDKICEKIHQQLKEHCLKTGMIFPGPFDDNDVPPSSQTSLKKTSKSSTDSTTKVSKTKRSKNYVPKPHSGGFGILVALFIADRNQIISLSKGELQERAQEYCKESMTKAKSGSHYTAWSCMKTLVNNELVEVEQKRTLYYSLTEKGRDLGRKLTAFLENEDIHPKGEQTGQQKVASSKEVASSYKQPPNDIFDSSDNDSDIACIPSTSRELSNYEPKSFSSQASTSSQIFGLQATSTVTSSQRGFCLKAGTFDVILLVDTRESASGVSSDLKKTTIISEFLNHSIKAEMRTLPAGDFTWIAREKRSKISIGQFVTTNYQKELILDVVIERKRVDDLASSIQDGRFHEQKHRLKKSGIRRPTYLVEHLTPGNGYSIPYRGLLTAVTNSQVIDGFSIKCTNTNRETMLYLVCMTNYLRKTFEGKDLYSCSSEDVQKEMTENADHFMTFSQFCESSKKVTNFTVQEMFMKHLLSFKGVSVVKAKAITQEHPTIKHLLKAYEGCTKEKEKLKLLSKIKSEGMSKAVGPVASDKIYRFYTFEDKKIDDS